MKLAISILDRPKIKELVDETRSQYSYHSRINFQFFVAGEKDVADDVIVSRSMPLAMNWLTEFPVYEMKYSEFHRPLTEAAVESVDHLMQTMYLHWGNFLKMTELLTLGDEFDRVVVIDNPSGIIQYSKRDERTLMEQDFLFVDSFNNPGSFESFVVDYDNFTCDVATFGKLVQLWKHLPTMGVDEVIWVAWLRWQTYYGTTGDDADFGKFVWRFWCARLGVKIRRTL